MSEKKWFKGNLHCHTTSSDGNLTPSEVVELYKSNGYDFLAITDHDVYGDYQENLGDDNFLILDSCECSIYYITDKKLVERYKNHKFNGTLDIIWDSNNMPNCDKVHHFNIYRRPNSKKVFNHGDSIEPIVIFEDREILQAEIDKYVNAGYFVIYNHPVWSGTKISDLADLKNLHSMEVYNHEVELNWGTGYATNYLDMLLRNGNKINGVATDDNHNSPKDNNSAGGYVMVNADNLTHEAISQALLDGEYYSSNGAEIIDFGIKDNKVFVECANIKTIRFIVGNKVIAGNTVHAKDYPLTFGEYKIQGHENYLRIECIDFNGKTAWTNPIYF